MIKIPMAAARKAANLTQEAVAEALGVTRTTVNKWEVGKTKMNPGYFREFCRITGFGEDDILLPEKSALSVQKK